MEKNKDLEHIYSKIMIVIQDIGIVIKCILWEYINIIIVTSITLITKNLHLWDNSQQANLME